MADRDTWFDRPLRHDRVFLAAWGCAVIAAAVKQVAGSPIGWADLPVAVWDLLTAFFGFTIILVSVRAYWRARYGPPEETPAPSEP